MLLHKYAYRCVSAKWQTGVVSDDYLSGRNEITGLSAKSGYPYKNRIPYLQGDFFADLRSEKGY